MVPCMMEVPWQLLINVVLIMWGAAWGVAYLVHEGHSRYQALCRLVGIAVGFTCIQVFLF